MRLPKTNCPCLCHTVQAEAEHPAVLFGGGGLCTAEPVEQICGLRLVYMRLLHPFCFFVVLVMSDSFKVRLDASCFGPGRLQGLGVAWGGVSWSHSCNAGDWQCGIRVFKLLAGQLPYKSKGPLAPQLVSIDTPAWA